MPHPAGLEIETLLSQCEIRRLRRSGPGGQHRNKVETAVVICHQPTGICGEASERRSQFQNQQKAIGRLRIKLALAVRDTRCDKASPSPLWESRRTGTGISVSAAHDDFPEILAEALDVLEANEWDAKASADHLNVSATQLVKLLRREPKALAQLNVHRQQQGLTPLL